MSKKIRHLKKLANHWSIDAWLDLNTQSFSIEQDIVSKEHLTADMMDLIKTELLNRLAEQLLEEACTFTQEENKVKLTITTFVREDKPC